MRFEEFVFRALISIFPEAFKVELNKNVLNVTFHGGVKPSDFNKRKVVRLLNELADENARYKYLVELPEIKRGGYLLRKPY